MRLLTLSIENRYTYTMNYIRLALTPIADDPRIICEVHRQRYKDCKNVKIQNPTYPGGFFVKVFRKDKAGSK